MGPHLVLIFLEKSFFYHYNAFCPPNPQSKISFLNALLSEQMGKLLRKFHTYETFEYFALTLVENMILAPGDLSYLTPTHAAKKIELMCWAGDVGLELVCPGVSWTYFKPSGPIFTHSDPF